MINDELRIILVFLSSFFGALFVLPRLSHIARRIGLLDHPNARKVHTTPRPLVGGIGIVVAATFSSLVLIPITGLRGYFLGLAVLLLIGFFDDFREIGSKQKFLAQIAATMLLIYFSKVSLTSFGDLLGFGNINIPGGPIVAWAVTIFCTVGVINSINLIDGLDGLAGGLSFIAFIIFAMHASFGGNFTIMLLNLALAGAVLGFLRFNWYPSVLFMGDAGSLSLGFSLSFMALVLTQGENAVMDPVIALLVLAVPITDTIVVMMKRISRGTNPFVADKYHLHHIFLRYGMGRAGAVRAILGISLLLGCISLLHPVYNIPEYVFFVVYVIYFIFYTIASFFILWMLRYSHRFRKNKPDKGAATPILRFVLGGLDAFKLFRKSPRYSVNLHLKCRDKNGNEYFQGKVLDISSDGCMASVKDLTFLHTSMFLTISFPFEDGTHEVELPAEHIWISENDKKFYHGFRFKEFDGNQEKVFFKFLVGNKNKV